MTVYLTNGTTSITNSVARVVVNMGFFIYAVIIMPSCISKIFIIYTNVDFYSVQLCSAIVHVGNCRALVKGIIADFY